MTVDEYEAWMRQRLLQAGFDFSHPDPGLAWEVFKKFASEPVESEDSYLFFEAADGSKVDGGYFDFVREFQQSTDEEAVYHEQFTVHFTNTLPDRLRIKSVAVFSSQFPDHESFFHAVEKLSAFRKGLAFTRWAVELRVDGC